MVEHHKTYIGSFKEEFVAAQIYDKFTILLNGPRAKTNFSYTKAEVLKLCSEFSFF